MATTLATVSTQFLQRFGLAKGTLRSYESTLMPLLKEYGYMPIEILTRQTLQEYLSSLTELAYTTHHRHQATIQALFNFAVEQGHIARFIMMRTSKPLPCRHFSHPGVAHNYENRYIRANPIARLKQRKPNLVRGEHDTDEVIRYLTPEQLKVLYQVIKPNARMNALVHLLHRTGARVSEILALNLEEINLSQRKFQVIGKGNKRRWCFYSEDAAQALERYLKRERHAGCPALLTA